MSTFLWILFWFSIVSAAIAGVSAAPWLPTRKKELKQLLEVLKKNPPKKIIDLGCGDGRILFAIAREFPQTTCHGAEISLLPFLAATLRKYLFFRSYKNVTIYPWSLYKMDLSSYDSIITFLLDGSYERLKQKWASELKDDTLVYVQAWPLKEVTEETKIKQEGILPLYIYRAQALRK
jgi:trans-aconitate methyltransferase